MPEPPRPQHRLQNPAPEVLEVPEMEVVVREANHPETIQQRKASQFSMEQRLVLASFREVGRCYLSKCRI